MTKDIKDLLKDISDKLGQIVVWTSATPEPISHYPDNLMEGWVISRSGEPAKISVFCIAESHAKQCFDQGNWRATEAEALLEVKRRAVTQKMRAYGFTPDWSDSLNQRKCFLTNMSSETQGGLRVQFDYRGQGLGLFEVYFETEEKAQACLDVLGDEILEVLV